MLGRLEDVLTNLELHSGFEGEIWGVRELVHEFQAAGVKVVDSSKRFLGIVIIEESTLTLGDDTVTLIDDELREMAVFSIAWELHASGDMSGKYHFSMKAVWKVPNYFLMKIPRSFWDFLLKSYLPDGQDCIMHPEVLVSFDGEEERIVPFPPDIPLFGDYEEGEAACLLSDLVWLREEVDTALREIGRVYKISSIQPSGTTVSDGESSPEGR